MQSYEENCIALLSFVDVSQLVVVCGSFIVVVEVFPMFAHTLPRYGCAHFLPEHCNYKFQNLTYGRLMCVRVCVCRFCSLRKNSAALAHRAFKSNSNARNWDYCHHNTREHGKWVSDARMCAHVFGVTERTTNTCAPGTMCGTVRGAEMRMRSISGFGVCDGVGWGLGGGEGGLCAHTLTYYTDGCGSCWCACVRMCAHYHRVAR